MFVRSLSLSFFTSGVRPVQVFYVFGVFVVFDLFGVFGVFGLYRTGANTYGCSFFL